MPRGDQTGPRGMGEMTGRAAGYCGGGRGWRNRFYATGLPGWMRFGGHRNPTPDPALEKRALQDQAQNLRSELELIEKRLAQIKTQANEQI